MLQRHKGLASVLLLVLIACSVLGLSIYSKREKQLATQTSIHRISKIGFKSISISDDSAASSWWVPNDQTAAISKVIPWIEKAVPYTGKLPQSEKMGRSGGYIGPARLTLKTFDNHLITIYPAFYFSKNGKVDTVVFKGNNGSVTKKYPEFQIQYIQYVLVFNNEGNISYIQSEALYNWLKDDRWKTELKRE